MNKLLGAKMDDLNEILNDMGNCLSKKSIKKIKDALENADYSNPECRKKLITYLKPILYNNKDMIIKTRKAYEKNLKDVFKKGKSAEDLDKIIEDKKKKSTKKKTV